MSREVRNLSVIVESESIYIRLKRNISVCISIWKFLYLNVPSINVLTNFVWCKLKCDLNALFFKALFCL